jgi:hypothetical protein
VCSEKPTVPKRIYGLAVLNLSIASIKVYGQSAVVFSLFLLKDSGCSQIILWFGYAVDHPVAGVRSYSSLFPLLYYDYQPNSDFRAYSIEASNKKEYRNKL